MSVPTRKRSIQFYNPVNDPLVAVAAVAAQFDTTTMVVAVAVAVMHAHDLVVVDVDAPVVVDSNDAFVVLDANFPRNDSWWHNPVTSFAAVVVVASNYHVVPMTLVLDLDVAVVDARVDD